MNEYIHTTLLKVFSESKLLKGKKIWGLLTSIKMVANLWLGI